MQDELWQSSVLYRLLSPVAMTVGVICLWARSVMTGCGLACSGIEPPGSDGSVSNNSLLTFCGVVNRIAVDEERSSLFALEC